MIDHERLWRVLRGFARALKGANGLDDALDELGEEIAGILGVAGAGIMLEDAAGDLRFRAASDPKLGVIEQLQIELGEGPCLLAYRSGQEVIASDVREDPRFPRFGIKAAEAGLCAVYSFPVESDGAVIGALNLYDDRAHALETEELEAAHTLADVAATYLVHLDEVARAATVNTQLEQALDRRVAVEQAKGYVAATLGVSLDEARDRLRRHARNEQRALREVAAAVVGGSLDPSTLPPA